MPKQTSRGRTANKVALQVSFDSLHCRYVHQVVRDVADNARLRGKHGLPGVELRTQPHHDTALRRVFSRKDIDVERAMVRASLTQAVANVTPERLKTMGSPGRQAVKALRQAARRRGWHDVKAGQIRSAVMLLAGSRRQKSFMYTPVKSARLVSVAAVGLQHGNVAHWTQLRKFCGDSVADRELLALLCTPDDNGNARRYESMQSCVLIFKSVALDYLLEAKEDDEQKKFQRLWRTKNNAILQLFLQRWTEARQCGRIGDSRFAWVKDVEWLVGGLQAAARIDDARGSGPTGMPLTGKRLTQTAPSLKPAQTRQPAKPPMRGEPLEKGRQSANRWLQNYAASPSSQVTSGSQGAVVRTSRVQAITNASPEQRSHGAGTKGASSVLVLRQIATTRDRENARAVRIRGAVELVAGGARKPPLTDTSIKPAKHETMDGVGMQHRKLTHGRQAYPESPSRLAKTPLPDKKSTFSCMADDAQTADSSAGLRMPGHTLLEMPVLAQIGKSVPRNAIAVDSTAILTETTTENLPETSSLQ
jgi:hypothetical protein